MSTALPTVALAGLLLLVVPMHGAAQDQTGAGASDWTPERHADGQPNISGMWDNTRALFTPVELAEERAGQELSAEELLARAEAAGQSLVAAGEWKGFENNAGGVGAYGCHWFDWYFDARQDIGQPALVVDPPTGRIPVRTANAAESIEMSAAEQFDSADRMDADDRCISRGPSGMWPTHVNNGKLILQLPGYVVIHSEMIHNVRIIPIDTPHADEKIRLWNGDPRGRWEANTLVGPDVLLYSATMDDADTFTAPWTVAFPFNRESDYLQFEFACHKGNYAVPGALSGAGRWRRGPLPDNPGHVC